MILLILILTVTNSSLEQVRETEIAIRGRSVISIKAVTLRPRNAHDCNTFDIPKAVEPSEQRLSARGPLLTHRFPPVSVTKLEMMLA